MMSLNHTLLAHLSLGKDHYDISLNYTRISSNEVTRIDIQEILLGQIKQKSINPPEPSIYMMYVYV